MFFKEIARILAIVLVGLSAVLLIPFVLAAYYQFIASPETHPQPHSTLFFLEAIAITLMTAALLYYYGKQGSGQIYRREGLATVVAIWALLPLFCALPFYLSGMLKNPFMAYFEAVSGLTTTGASTLQAKDFDSATGKEIPIVKTFKGVLNTTYSFYGTIEPVRNEAGEIILSGYDAVSRALMFWRSFIQWLGGGGIVVLFVAILPALGVGGKMLYQSEVPGPIKGAMTPRIKETAINLWLIYLSLTAIIFGIIYLTNVKISWLDAIVLTFGSLSTGGFSMHDSSVAYYESSATDWAVIIAMLIGSVNFAIYYFIWKRKLYKIFKPELLIYAAIIAITCILATLYLVNTPQIPLTGQASTLYSLSNAFRDGTFQVVSAISTTGYVTTNFDFWPYTPQALMLIVMFVGGMSGSTAGGIKIMRHYMLFRIAQNKVESLFQPQTIQTFKVEDKEVEPGAIVMVLTFFLFTITVSVAGTLLYILDDLDPQTALGAVACMVNNTGIAFRMAGPADSCAFMTDFSLTLSSLLMILGRLEFFAVFALLVPTFWNENK